MLSLTPALSQWERGKPGGRAAWDRDGMNENGGTALMRDTRPEAQEVYFEILAKIPPAKKLEQALKFSRALKDTMRIAIREQHPEYTEHQVRLELIRRCHGDEVLREHFPEAENEL